MGVMQCTVPCYQFLYNAVVYRYSVGVRCIPRDVYVPVVGGSPANFAAGVVNVSLAAI